MSNLANYSPYNKTYKFIMFQNQAYHQKNKLNAKPCIRTNLRYLNVKNNSFIQFNPENNKSQIFNKMEDKQPTYCESPSNSVNHNRSSFFTSRSLRQSNPHIKTPKRVIHKHASYQKFQNKKIQKSNSKLVNRLISTNCQVIKKQKSQKSFKNHLKYREIRNKYDDEGNRKDVLVLGKQILLCPTLKEYNDSGLASKFIQDNMSWYRSTSSRTSLRKRKSNLSCV